MTYWNDLSILRDISEEIEKSAIEDINYNNNELLL